MSNQNTKKSPGIESALFNCTQEMGMDYFVINKKVLMTTGPYCMSYIGFF